MNSAHTLNRLALALTLGCSVTSCGGDSSSGGTQLIEIPAPLAPIRFREVTNASLPGTDLLGFSMDASIADIDADGDPDIVIAHEFQPNILLLNDGDGAFTNSSAERLPRTFRDSEDVSIADFDGDGDLDIVIVSEDDQVNELYLNDGTGRFSDDSARLPVTGVSNAVLIANIDDNDSPDILIGNNGQNVILINNGDAEFTDETADRLPVIFDITQDLELGDVDGDNDLDLLVGNEDSNQLLLNDGNGVFAAAPTQNLPLRATPEETREADFGDVDGDGDLDILFANVQLFVAGAERQNRLLINDGEGIFSDETATRLPADNDRSMDGDFIDVDADGDVDIVTANLDTTLAAPANAPYRVYRNDGTGLFEDATATLFPTGVVGNGLDIEAFDADEDGLVDLYLSSRGGTDRLLVGTREE